ncbi:hypothetical protein VIGAN_01207300 [Vigna angularis var. angularis]|uniref:Uncharacterized protein n=1 Tax=Vigna angularis var. angularis TaxID=157739 RepID=A0A0S3R1E9_PHAAN|nr:hypothetical protein VIGAN_01207300 [Vigna angularis var. angularis]
MPPQVPQPNKPNKFYFFYGHWKPSQNRPTDRDRPTIVAFAGSLELWRGDLAFLVHFSRGKRRMVVWLRAMELVLRGRGDMGSRSHLSY